MILARGCLQVYKAKAYKSKAQSPMSKVKDRVLDFGHWTLGFGLTAFSSCCDIRRSRNAFDYRRRRQPRGAVSFEHDL